MKDLLEARNAAYHRIAAQDGGSNAFGVWIPREGRASRKIAAQQAQSFELRVMMAMLPTLIAEADIRVLSWLHDGVTIRFADSREKSRKIKRLKESVQDEAERNGMVTELEVEER